MVLFYSSFETDGLDTDSFGKDPNSKLLEPSIVSIAKTFEGP